MTGLEEIKAQLKTLVEEDLKVGTRAYTSQLVLRLSRMLTCTVYTLSLLGNRCQTSRISIYRLLSLSESCTAPP